MSAEARLRDPAVYSVPGRKWGFVRWVDVCHVLGADPIRVMDAIFQCRKAASYVHSLEVRILRNAEKAWILNLRENSFVASVGDGSNYYRHTTVMMKELGLLVPIGFARRVRDDFKRHIKPLIR